ncbi:MAG: tetrahydromethanopterin S-methyltransferase subunit A [Methanophagales archaeon]|nr:tetrahydromethanopterin S-methyltransferase subunit A [Methanophagales archaeon]
MVEKKEPAEGWPVATGDYEIGDPKNPVAVSSSGGHFKDDAVAELLSAGAAIVGSCKTENIGLEKQIANIISNPNIRFYVLSGPEVPGHVCAGSLVKMHEKGVDTESHKIIDAPGAIPFIENVPHEAVERFRQQVEIIDMIGSEDIGAIKAKVQECVGKDPGAFPEDPMVVKVGEEEEEAAELEMPLAMSAVPYMDTITGAVESARYKSQMLARDYKLSMAISKNTVLGLAAGFLLAFVVAIPFIAYWALAGVI